MHDLTFHANGPSCQWPVYYPWLIQLPRTLQDLFSCKIIIMNVNVLSKMYFAAIAGVECYISYKWLHVYD